MSTVMPVKHGFEVTSSFGPRWGTIHYGTDFGRPGGCGGEPVFAIRAGTVTNAGPASGFGRWVCVDHPAEVGGGLSVYGHVVPEVRVGQRVEAGQRIAHIDPNKATNGGVDPHLHVEFHRYVWSPPGPNRLDPMTILRGAPWPDGALPVFEPKGGTIFGVDISEHQDGMPLTRAAEEGIQFAIVRTTDGTYKDRTYRSHVDDGRGAGLVLAAYHYLRNPSEGTTIRQQVDASLAVMGEHHRLPMWLDCETDAGLHPDHIREAKRLFEDAGIRVIGCYSYVPWWEGRIAGGEPDSHEFGAFWVAAYGRNPYGAPRVIYPGDNHAQWSYPLGNQLPIIWQFGSNASVAGRSVDINAFKGNVDQLRALFTGEKPREENIMLGITREILDIVKDIRAQLRGPELKGWLQLGQNAKGQFLTLVDAVSALRKDIAHLTDEVKNLKKEGK